MFLTVAFSGWHAVALHSLHIALNQDADGRHLIVIRCCCANLSNSVDSIHPAQHLAVLTDTVNLHDVPHGITRIILIGVRYV